MSKKLLMWSQWRPTRYARVVRLFLRRECIACQENKTRKINPTYSWAKALPGFIDAPRRHFSDTFSPFLFPFALAAESSTRGDSRQDFSRLCHFPAATMAIILPPRVKCLGICPLRRCAIYRDSMIMIYADAKWVEINWIGMWFVAGLWKVYGAL